MVEEDFIDKRAEKIKELNEKIKKIESLLMDLEKISGKLLDSPIMQEEKTSFSDIMTNIYYTRDKYANERDDIYKQINKERRREIRKSEKEDKEFIKKLLEKKGLK